MPVTSAPAHGGPRRAQGAFLPATRSTAARYQQISSPRMMRPVKLAASGGFHPDHVGASAPTDATVAPASLATPASGASTPGALLPYFVSIFDHFRDHASSLAQQLGSAEPPSFLPSLGLGPHLRLPGSRDAGSNVAEASGESPGTARRLLPLWQHHAPHIKSSRFDATHHHQQQQQQQDLQDWKRQQHADDGHSWVGPLSTHLHWSSGTASPSSNDASAPGSGSGRVPVTAADGPPHPSPPHPLQHQLPAGPSDLHRVRLATQTGGLVLLWHSALALQQRTLMTALLQMGQAVEAADKARRNMPQPAEVPALVHWGAVAAAARAEETVALALARTATAAAAAAAGVPAAAAAVTGGAPAAAAPPPPYLPMLRHARRRLLAAAVPMRERLRGLQGGCTTHVLLRFVLFSAVNPRMRRDLRVRLDVLARRAGQVAMLQEQHDAWVARKLPTAAPAAAASAGVDTTVPTHGSSADAIPPPQSAAAAAAASAGSLTEPLSARWYRRVFAPEMLACARQLQLEAPGSPPDDRAAGDPPGRFDLRDLYRLIRVIEVAAEDLERYDE